MIDRDNTSVPGQGVDKNDTSTAALILLAAWKPGEAVQQARGRDVLIAVPLKTLQKLVAGE